MPIVYHEKSKEFHLYNKEVSYLFQIIDNGQTWASFIMERD